MKYFFFKKNATQEYTTRLYLPTSDFLMSNINSESHFLFHLISNLSGVLPRARAKIAKCWTI